MSSKCRLCENPAFIELIDLGPQPLANKYPKKEDFKEEFIGNLNVNFCAKCFSAQIDLLYSRDEMFVDYYYLSSVNQGLVDHFSALAKYIKSFDFVVDIGSNDGVLLQHLKSQGSRFLGVDPSINVGGIANQRGLTTEIGFFDQDMVKKIEVKYGNPDCIVASSVVTHMENPQEFFENCARLLAPTGTLIVEVEYLNSILKKSEFERFYFDRPYYYSISSLDYLAEKAGLLINKVTEINQHGGSIRIEFTHRRRKMEPSKQALHSMENEQKSLTENVISFQSRVSQQTQELHDFLLKKKDLGKEILAYGCPARFATITNFANLDKKLIPRVIDDSPLKAGRFSPGKHIPIIEYDEDIVNQSDVFLIFAYEYFSTIRNKIPRSKTEIYRPAPLQRLV